VAPRALRAYPRGVSRPDPAPRSKHAFVAAGALGCALACLCAGACLPGSGPALLDGDNAGGGTGTDLGGDAGLQRGDVDLGDPFALYGLSPSHGPFSGATTVRLTGRGFSPKLRVFIGGIEVQAIAGDPTRAVVVTPPGSPGPVDVKIRDDATAKERVLEKGFYYDAFVVVPDSGATSGGTRIRLTNGGVAWKSPIQIAIGGAACTNVVESDGKSAECVTTAGAPGAKDVTVLEADGTSTQAREAFTYSDSPDGYRGGLAGGAFAGRMRVLAFDAATGVPIPGAYVIAGGSIAGGVVQQTSASGVTELSGLPGTKATITVAAKCHQPITYVDVPVDTVTAYLPFVFDVACASLDGDPPSTGGRGGKFGGVVEGELVFPGGAEFQRTGWSSVPAPLRPTERRAAYVFEVAGSPNESFQLPPASEAITPDTEGGAGYKFALVVFPGNVSLYVIAGLEDRSESPARFVPYAMGVARGISVPVQTRVTGVDVMMDVLFDHQVTVAPQPPLPGPRGPDRFASSIAMTFGAQGFVILPRGVQVAPYPVPATMPFIGVPSLDHGVSGEQYVLGGVAATGANLQRPASLVSRIRTTNANDPVSLGGFLGVPVLGQPASGLWNGTKVQFSGASGQFDLSVTQISSGNGLVTWTVAAPSGVTSFDLPDLHALPGPDTLGLREGEIETTVRVGRIEAFSYGKVRQGQLTPGSWNAQAFDSLTGVYAQP
jgi:hypothetical protein